MKTAEEIAREMYPDYETETYLHNNVTRKIQRDAFVKGYQRRCLEEHTEMGEYGCKHAEQEDLPNS